MNATERSRLQLRAQVFRVWNWRVPEPGQLPMPVLLHPVETDTSMAFPVRAQSSKVFTADAAALEERNCFDL